MDFGLSSLDDFLGSGSNLAASRASSMAANNHKLFNFPSSPTPQASFPSKVYGFQSSPSAYDQASSGAGGPFTASQWMELEYQVLIFKYLSASVPVPPELLTALIKKPLCLYSYRSSGGFYRPDLLGRIGYRGSPVDSEPGRCRRTDGKKWRCSRDVVGDQKYCERHMNRGRYRNRKPVDGQTSMPATAQQTANSNGLPVVGSTSSALVISSSEPVNVTTQQQTKDSEVAAAVNVKSDEEAAFTVPKPIEEESSDSFISSSKKRKYVNSEDCDEPFPSFNKQDTEEQHPLRQFIEDSPEDQRNRSAISWAEELKSDWNQLSLSAPVQEKIALSMNMGVIGDFSEPNQKKSKWVSISPAGTSISDPLGEILITKNTGNAGGSCQSSSTAR